MLKATTAATIVIQNEEELPWHFSFIDEWVCGSSFPCERDNIKGILESNVGLIVNLTESASHGIVKCEKCLWKGDEVVCDFDIFEDVQSHDNLFCLLLPIKDGHIPSFKQVEMFLLHTTETIKKGKRVVVHCHAGVGRTGVLLCIYLMITYDLTPEEALDKLRAIRPQSMQFNASDWTNDPFIVSKPNSYIRNLLQERFIHLYYEQVVLPNRTIHSSGTLVGSLSTSFDSLHSNPLSPLVSATPSGTPTVSPIFSAPNVTPTGEFPHNTPISSSALVSRLELLLEETQEMESANLPPQLVATPMSPFNLEAKLEYLMIDEHVGRVDPDTHKSVPFVFVPEFTDEQVDRELSGLLEEMEIRRVGGEEVCWYCRGAMAVGPSRVVAGQEWPEGDVAVLYHGDV